MTSFELRRAYAKSEARLKKAARSGNEAAVAREMEKHRKYEYAMLYKKFKKKRR